MAYPASSGVRLRTMATMWHSDTAVGTAARLQTREMAAARLQTRETVSKYLCGARPDRAAHGSQPGHGVGRQCH
jgi:hypothetical protein